MRKPVPRVRWKVLALPNEHGAYAFVLEPALLGLLAAPSRAGAALAVAGFAALLLQHPLSLALADLRRGRRYPRTLPAVALAVGYALLTCGALLAAAALGAGTGAFLVLASALPLAALQLAFDARNRGRAVLPELVGAVALASLAAAIVLAGGGSMALGLSLWCLMAARAVPSILYVRTRLRQQRAQRAAPRLAVALHAAVLLPLAGLVAFGPLPALSLVAFLALLARAVLGLRPGAPAVRPSRTGVLEMGYGLMTVMTVGLALALGA